MVDPKRHIYILSAEEQAFLEECEHEYANRFTDLDEEFMEYCKRAPPPPPIVFPWNPGYRRGGGGGGPWRGHRNDRRFYDRGRGGHYSQGQRYDGSRQRSYHGDRDDYNRNNHYEHRSNHRDHHNRYERGRGDRSSGSTRYAQPHDRQQQQQQDRDANR
uniref:Uncharacterized protein n=1 Tax=Anopheles braziliensis TaxID=58242 RepID=A0A2M3ZAA8_9DIPT